MCDQDPRALGPSSSVLRPQQATRASSRTPINIVPSTFLQDRLTTKCVGPKASSWASTHMSKTISFKTIWPPSVWVQRLLQGLPHTCQRPYKVIIIIKEFHDPNKGCKVITNTHRGLIMHSFIKPSSVGPTDSSRLLHAVRGFFDFFNHLNNAREPPRVKIHHDITCGVARASAGVPWHH